MAEDKRELFKSLGFLSSVGITLVVSTFIGLGMGWWLDQKLATKPWFTLIFLVLGIVSGFRSMYILTAREVKRQKEEDRKNGDDQR